MLIHLEKLGKSFGEKIVLHDVTASVEREDRIGIVGQNGAGKTTLLKILTGEYQDYEGEFSVTHGVTLGYLEQNAKLDATLDLYGEMRSTFAPVLDAMAQMQVLERKMAAQPDDTELLARHDQLQNIVDAADGYNMDVNIKKVLSGMGFAQDTWQKNIAVLSGGELPVDAEANPVLQAFAADNAATVKVTGDAVENGKLGGKATITVTSADESETKTYTVTFKAFTLASLKVTGPTKIEYAIGDKLDTAGLKVTAVYQSGDKTKEVPVALDDPQLAIGSFDSTAAGKKAITVSYRGVTATFNVTVKANAVAPGPEEQKPGSTNKPGATGNGNKNTVANTGSSVAAIAGAVALLAAAAGALFMLRKRA